jgi:hypothetical protein
MRFFILTVFVITSLSLFAQFDPAGGELGSKAVYYESAAIKSWATQTQFSRGWMNITDTTLGSASSGFDTDAIGKANGECVSLGDGGWALIELDDYLKDNKGYEFAVYENGFKSGSGYFLEFAHVEVSSDGIHFIRFPSETFLDTINQYTNPSVLDPTKVNNLAGKHPVFWGTPFDIAALPLSEWLNKDSIKFIKIIDVVGSLNPLHVNFDSKEKKINDPWPTPWASSGFDLDAVAILSPGFTGQNELAIHAVSIYPNPCITGANVNINLDGIMEIEIMDAMGKTLSVVENQSAILAPQNSGLYQLRITTHQGIYYTKLCVR